MIFLILLICIIIVYLLLNKTELKKYNEKNWLFILFVFAAFTIIQGYRGYNVGSDTKNYIKIYNSIEKMSVQGLLIKSNMNIEIGYKLFMKLLCFLHMPSRIMLTIMAMIINGGVLYFIYKYSKNPLLSVIIFMGTEFFTLSFTALRQMTAVVIILNAYPYIKTKKIIPSVLLILVASLFHISALIFIPVIIFPYIKIDKKSLIIILCLFILMHLIGIPVLQMVISKTKYAVYLQENTEGQGIKQCIVIFIYTILGMYLNYKNNDKKGYSDTIILIMITAIFIQSLAYKIQLVNRCMWYFYIFSIIYLPNLIAQVKDKRKMQVLNILIGVLNIVQFLLFSINMYNILPYNFMNL